MKIVVTGACGFIGSNFVRMALSDRLPGLEGCSIVALDALTYSGVLQNLDSVQKNRNFLFVRDDILNATKRKNIFSGADAVVHFAAESHVDRSFHDASEFVRTNVLGTQVLLDACIQYGVKKFIHISTDEVYGSILEGSWDESCPLEPNSPYAASKAASDLIVRSYNKSHNLHTCITRCSNNYGPYQFPEKVIPLFITNILEGQDLPIYGSGQNVRDWLFVDDHCRGIALVLQKGVSGEVYNIGGGTLMSNLDLAQKLLALVGNGNSKIVHVEDRKAHDFRYCVNIDKIAKELGYAPTVDFEDGLLQVVAWYTNNETWWKPLKKRLLNAK